MRQEVRTCSSVEHLMKKKIMTIIVMIMIRTMMILSLQYFSVLDLSRYVVYTRTDSGRRTKGRTIQFVQNVTYI